MEAETGPLTQVHYFKISYFHSCIGCKVSSESSATSYIVRSSDVKKYAPAWLWRNCMHATFTEGVPLETIF